MVIAIVVVFSFKRELLWLFLLGNYMGRLPWRSEHLNNYFALVNYVDGAILLPVLADDAALLELGDADLLDEHGLLLLLEQAEQLELLNHLLSYCAVLGRHKLN